MKVVSSPNFRGRGPLKTEQFIKEQLPQIQRENEEVQRNLSFEDNFNKNDLEVRNRSHLDVLLYDSNTGKWENRTIVAGSGIGVVNDAENRTLTFSRGRVGGYAISNWVTRKTYDANAVSLHQLADVLCTVINEFQTGNYSLSGYSISNLSTDKTYDADLTSEHELADVLGSFITDCMTAPAMFTGYTINNLTYAKVLNARAVSVSIFADVLGTLITEIQL